MLHSCRLSRVYPRCRVLDNFGGGLEGGCLLQHRTHGTVLVFGEPYGLLQRPFVDSNTSDHVMDSNRGEHLWWTLRLFGLHAHPISGDLLVVFLPKNGNDIECGATGESDGKHLDWL